MNKPRYDLDDIRAAAAGNWAAIHAALGIPDYLLDTRKHFPCPACGGKDRFRYTDYQGGGGFICNQCTADGGSGFDLIMLVLGLDFKEAVNAVAGVLGMSHENAAQTRYTPKIAAPAPLNPPQDKLPALLRVWECASPLRMEHAAAAYLQGRGIPLNEDALPANLRYMAAADYWVSDDSGKPVLLATLPAMIAAITDTQGQLQGLHKTYLQQTPAGWQKWRGKHPQTSEDLPAKKMQNRYIGSIKGAAVHLSRADEQGRLIVCEGIETALAAQALFGMPAIAALSAYGMKSLHIPPDVKELFICADNDHSKTGFRAAHDLTIRAIRLGIKANIWQPETTGFDALDELNARRAKIAQTNPSNSSLKGKTS